MPGSNPPISNVQEVRASPPNPSSVSDALVKPRPVPGASRAAPTSDRRAVGMQYRAPLKSILQAQGFAGVPIPDVQEVRASPPSPSAINTSLLNRQPVPASSLKAPVSNRRAVEMSYRAPIAAILQAGGLSGSDVLNGSNILNAAPMGAGGLGAIGVDTSVSAQVRAAKALRADGVPVSLNYTSAIRSAAGGFAPPRMPKQGFMAAAYKYPSQAMVVGATLSGAPIVVPMPTRGSSPNPPRFVTRERGQGPRLQINESPSEARRRMLSTLMGLSAMTPDDRAGVVMDFKNQSVLFAALDATLNAINSAIMLGARYVADVAGTCVGATGGYCDLVPQPIIDAVARGEFNAPQIDPKAVYGQLSNLLHRKQIELPRVAIQSALGDAADQFYSLLTSLLDKADSLPSVLDSVKKYFKQIRDYLTYNVPDELRADWIRFLYKKVAGTVPSEDTVNKLLNNAALAQASTYDGALSIVRANVPAGGSSSSSSSSSSVMRSSDILRRGGIFPGAVNPTLLKSPIVSKAMKSAVVQSATSKKFQAAVKAPPPAADSGGGMDTTTILLGVVALAAVAFVATR